MERTRDYTKELNRTKIINEFTNFLSSFEQNKHNLTISRGIYISGDTGVGKTHLVKQLLKSLNYDIVYYDASDIRNKTIVDNLANNNMSDRNVLSMFNKTHQRIAIVMDEVDGMNNGDKGGINNLIKLIRPKKTKKQKKEEYTLNPIICISNNHVDKKIIELKKVCVCINIPKPTSNEIIDIINTIPNINLNIDTIANYVNGDLRKLDKIINLIKNNTIDEKILKSLFEYKTSNDNTKQIAAKLLTNYYPLTSHNDIISETDRTSVGLLFHENVIDVLSNKDISLYVKLLENICYADYIDRITFQKQIWIFNEMTSIVKTFYNNKLLHNTKSCNKLDPLQVRFTKVLTKYASEYNNNKFVQYLCQMLNIDKKDLYLHFLKLRESTEMEDIYNLYEQYDVTDLEIKRLYKLIDGIHSTIDLDEDDMMYNLDYDFESEEN